MPGVAPFRGIGGRCAQSRRRFLRQAGLIPTRNCSRPGAVYSYGGVEMTLSRTAGLVLLALATACTEPSKPLAIPDPADIESMYVYRLTDSVSSWAYETMDRRRIAAVLARLREH